MQKNLPNSLPSPLWLGGWRLKIKTLAEGVFSPPYLPARFILFFLLTNITHFAVTVMNYSPAYWHSSLKVNGVAHGSSALENSPTEWMIFAVVYLSIAIFCLVVFNYRWSLIGWLTAETIHFYGIGNWLDNCSFGRWSPTLGRSCASFDGRLFWVICGLVLGGFIASSLHQSTLSFQNKKVEKGLRRFSPILPAVWSVILIAGIASSAQKPGLYGWQPVDVEHKPGPLSEAETAYDTRNNELVLFGGVAGHLDTHWDFKSETWVWDGRAWHNMYPAIYPSGRTKHAMAYDENRGVVVMFGGYGDNGLLEDTWEWNGFTWANHCTCAHPAARYAHEMYYDSARKKVVLYGGYDGETEFNDAWEWDGEDCRWNEIQLGEDPPGASYFSLLRTPRTGGLLAVLSGYPGGTWTLNDDAWTRLPLALEPGDRVRTSTVYDPRRGTFLLFGGELQDTNLNDTWLFDGKSWSQFATQTQPSIRSDMVLWYDPVRGHIMLFGGQNGKAYFNDMWEFVFPEK